MISQILNNSEDRGSTALWPSVPVFNHIGAEGKKKHDLTTSHFEKHVAPVSVYSLMREVQPTVRSSSHLLFYKLDGMILSASPHSVCSPAH